MKAPTEHCLPITIPAHRTFLPYAGTFPTSQVTPATYHNNELIRITRIILWQLIAGIKRIICWTQITRMTRILKPRITQISRILLNNGLHGLNGLFVGHRLHGWGFLSKYSKTTLHKRLCHWPYPSPTWKRNVCGDSCGGQGGSRSPPLQGRGRGGVTNLITPINILYGF